MVPVYVADDPVRTHSLFVMAQNNFNGSTYHLVVNHRYRKDYPYYLYGNYGRQIGYLSWTFLKENGHPPL